MIKQCNYSKLMVIFRPVFLLRQLTLFLCIVSLRYELVESASKGSKATEQTTIKRVQLTEDDRIQWVRDVKNITDT